MKGKKSRKNSRSNRELVIRRKDMIICHILAIAGVLVIIGGLFVPANMVWLSMVLFVAGALAACFGFFARDFFFRCPACGRSLMKDQPFKSKMKGIVPKGCPQCSWATKIEYIK